MKTAIGWLLAAAALSTTSAHATSIRQDGAGVPAGEAVTQPLPAQDRLYDDTAADLPHAPAGLGGFYGVDLSAAGAAAKDSAADTLRLTDAPYYADSRAYPVREQAASATPAPQEGTPEPEPELETIVILTTALAGLTLSSLKKG